jgi:ribonuclease HI
MIKIYTDGSCRNNGYANSAGGWAFVVVKDELAIYSRRGGCRDVTNNQMELRAIKRAIEWFENQKWAAEECVEIYTDSAYIHNCMGQRWYVNWQKNGWVNSKKEPVKNREYWEFLIPYFNNERFFFHKVKGHNGEKWNEYVDKLAQEASANIKELKD